MSVLRTAPARRASTSRGEQRPGRAAGLQRWGVPVLLAAVAYIPLLASKPGMVEADTKQYLYLNPGKLLAGASTLWDPNVGMGTVTHQNIGYLFPMGPFFWVFNAIGVPVWVAQRLWIGSLLFAAGMGMLFLVRTLAAAGSGPPSRAGRGDGSWRSAVTVGTNWGTPAVTVAALAFMLSPYVLQYEARISALLMPWAALPWLVALVVRALRVGGWRYPAIFALVTAITGAVNATSIVYVLIAPLLWFPYAVWVLREVSLRRAVVTLLRIGVLTALLSLWWLAGLATQAGYGLDVLRYSETVQAVASASLSYDILRGLGFWFFYGQDGIGPWIQASVDFTRWPWLLLVSYAVPAVAFLAAAVIRWRHRLYFVALIGIAVAIAVGVHPYDHPAAPLGSLLKSFATGSTAGLALRNAARAIPLLALGAAMLLAAGVEALSAWWSRLGIVAAVAIGGLVAADMAPLWAGQFVDANLSRPSQIPSYYQAAAKYLDAQGNATRVMALPGIDFATYRWGNNLVDPVEPGIMSRPFVAREQVPWGSPPSADLLLALDDRMQQGTFDPTSLGPLARLMGVGDVELRSDLQYERYLTARTLPTAAKLDPPPAGLDQPVRFGPPASLRTSVPLVDEQSLGPSATTPDPADLQVYGVTNPRSILRAEPAQQPLVVAGNGDALVDGASAGLLDGQQTILYQGDLDTNAGAERQALGAGADLVLTDTNRRRAQRWDTITQSTGYTERVGESPPEPDPNDNPLPLFPGATDNSRTVTQQDGIASVQASGYGNPVSYTPANRPDLAMDGDLSTSWEVAAFSKVDNQGQYLRFNMTHAVTTNQITVVQPQNGPRDRFVTHATLRFDHGPDVPVQLGPSSLAPTGQTITFPTRTFGRVDLVIDTTNFGVRSNYKTASGVGFAEVRVGGGPNGGPIPPVDEVTRLPTDLLSQAGPASSDHRLVILMTRLRADPSQPIKSPPVNADEERTMARTFSLPTARTFSVSGTARISADAPDDTIDRLLGRPTSGPGSDLMVTSSSRLSGDLSNRGESAFDGDPVTFWSPQFGDQVGQWLQLQQPQPVTVRLSIQADGQRPVIADVPGVADLSRTNGTVQVPVTFPAVQGSTIRVTIDGVRQESTVDFLSGLPSVLPVGIAELGIPGVTLPPAGPTVPNACRTDLMTVDGNPTGVRIVGSTSAGSALQGLEVQACGPGSSGLSLGPGNHVVRTSQGAATGIDLDQLGLGSERGGAALAAGPTGQVVPTATTAASPVPSVRVLSQDRTTSKVAVDVPASKSPFWLVLGQSFNSGWTAQVNGGPSLGKPRSVDGYANGWLVQPRTSGQMLVTLHWKPQDRVNLALYVSAVAGILCLLLVFWRPRRRDDGDRHPPDTATTAATEPAGGDAPARPQLVSPLRSTGRPLSLQASLVVTLASAAVSGLVIGPWAAPVVGLAVAVVLLRPRLRALLTIGAVLCAAISGLYITQLEVRYHFPAGADWPSSFSAVTWVAWLAVALLVGDAVIEYLRSVHRQT
ncbi:MAG: DUF3367 domain-containing protein [Actinobacteria bacterium]|nr:MAG: DUF3367 domain-containing protein [Actinomycetota bacterium]